MKEQLYIAKERLQATGKGFKKALRNPLAYALTTGGGMILFGGANMVMSPDRINRELNQTFPLTSSRENVAEAQREVLTFTDEFYKRVANGQTKVDIADFSNPLQIAQAIAIKDQEEQRSRREKTLEAHATALQFSGIGGGVILTLSSLLIRAMAESSKNLFRGKPTQQAISKRPANA